MGNYEIKASSSIAKDWQKMESELPEAMDECKKFLQRSPANRLQSGGKLKKLQGKHKGKLQYDIDDSHRVWYEVDKKKRIITVKYIGSHP